MGDRYYLKLNCAYCNKQNPSEEDFKDDPLTFGIYYAPSSGTTDFICQFCKKKNTIIENFKAMKDE